MSSLTDSIKLAVFICRYLLSAHSLANARDRETRATGILSTVYIKPDEVSPYGNVVSPGVLATNHQHIFSIRMDTAIDGNKNTVVQEDSLPMPVDDDVNPYGVGYTVAKTPIKTSGFADAELVTKHLPSLGS